MENKFETIQYKTEIKTIDLYLSLDNLTVYLTAKQMSALFSKSVDTINLYTKKLASKPGFIGSVYEDFSATAADGKHYKTKLYSMHFVEEISRKIGSESGFRLKQFVDQYLVDKYSLNPNIIIYDNGKSKISVNVSPLEETVWVTLNDIADLYETTRQNIALHIQNIIEEGELDYSTCKKNLHVY